jgi:hypothetical protein
MTEFLREGLRDLAEEVAMADLRDRSIRTSRRITAMYRVATVAGAIVAVAVVAIGTRSFLPLAGGPPVDPGPSGTGSVAPTPSVSPTPTGPPPGPMVIGAVELDGTGPLDDARIPMADWQHEYCPVGPTQFTDGQWAGSLVAGTFVPVARLEEQVVVDVTGDDVTDVVAHFVCDAGTDPGAYAAQVAVYTPDGGGGWDLLGQVAVGTPRRVLAQAAVPSDRTIVVQRVIRDESLVPISVENSQFRWSGSRFAAVGTPTSIPVDLSPADLSVSVAPATLPGGSGDLVVTVTYSGGQGLVEVVVGFESPVRYTITGPGDRQVPMFDFGQASDFGRYYARVRAEPPAAGASVAGTFRFTPVQTAGPITVRIFAVVQGRLEVDVSGTSLVQVPTP